MGQSRRGFSFCSQARGLYIDAGELRASCIMFAQSISQLLGEWSTVELLSKVKTTGVSGEVDRNR